MMQLASLFDLPSLLDFNITRLLVYEQEMTLQDDTSKHTGNDQLPVRRSSLSNVSNDDAIFGSDDDEISSEFDIKMTNYSQQHNATARLPFDEWGTDFQRVIIVLHVYVLPVIILIGIVGNTLTFFVYVGTPRLYRQSSSVYLVFLAAVDNISLIFVFVVWFGWVGPHLVHKNGWCQTITYCTYVCSFLSAWTVVSFTCERWIVVFHPLKRHWLCTRRRAIIVMTSLTVGSMAFYSFSLFSQSVKYVDSYPVCVSVNNFWLRAIQSLDTILVVVVPMFAIFIMNAAIGIKICHYTGRDTFDRFSDVISRPAATGNNGNQCGGAGGGATTGGEGDHRVHQIDHGGSPGDNDQHSRRQLQQQQQNGSHHQQRYFHHHSHHHHHHHPGCPNDLIYSNCSLGHVANSQHFAASQQQLQSKCAAHDMRSVGYVASGPGNAPGYHLAIQLQPMQSASSSGPVGAQPVPGTAVAGGSGPHSTVPSVGGGAGGGDGAVGTMTTATIAVVSAVHTTAGGRSWRILTKKHHTQLRITRGLLIVSTVFVALNLPSYAFRIHAFVIGLKNELYPKDSLHAYIWQEFIQFLYYSNFSSRFFLYSACSRNFRHAVLRLLACRAKRSNYFHRG